jgi:hypothetical protein
VTFVASLKSHTSLFETMRSQRLNLLNRLNKESIEKVAIMSDILITSEQELESNESIFGILKF